MIDTERDDSRAPWTPPGLRLPRVGDRVVVRLSDECPSHWCKGYDGRAGRVSLLESDLVALTDGVGLADGHQIFVAFGPPRSELGQECGWFAAIELEILADDDGRE